MAEQQVPRAVPYPSLPAPLWPLPAYPVALTQPFVTTSCVRTA